MYCGSVDVNLETQQSLAQPPLLLQNYTCIQALGIFVTQNITPTWNQARGS